MCVLRPTSIDVEFYQWCYYHQNIPMYYSLCIDPVFLSQSITMQFSNVFCITLVVKFFGSDCGSWKCDNRRFGLGPGGVCLKKSRKDKKCICKPGYKPSRDNLACNRDSSYVRKFLHSCGRNLNINK